MEVFTRSLLCTPLPIDVCVLNYTPLRATPFRNLVKSQPCLADYLHTHVFNSSQEVYIFDTCNELTIMSKVSISSYM